MRPYALALLAFVLIGCAEGRGRARLDAAPFEGGTDDGSAGDALDGALDAPASDGSLDAEPSDAPRSDVPTLDAPPFDGGVADAGAAVSCTPETAAATCGGRPCVDGYCCNSACGSPCDACNLPGLLGICSPKGAGSACDDGNACTRMETCDEFGACAGGASLNCDAMDTTCRDFSCDGTATCAVAPRNVGGACDDGSASTSGDTCRADGSCLGVAGCAAPANACANGSESRDGCGNARVIGRQSAATAAGFTVTDNTCSARNRFDDCSWDAGNDHAYRIWMRTGEQIAVQVDLRDLCFSGFSATLKLYESTGCTDVTCGSDRWCHDFVDERVPYNYTAVRDGWIVVVVDGSTAFDDEGTYSLNVRLTRCAEPTCGCS